MTTQALSNPKTRRGFWNTAAFLGELRRSWANAVLFFLAYFFGLTVPMLNDLSTYRRSDFYDSFTIGQVRELDYYIPALYVAIAMAAAVWAAITACGYLHKRISVYHFHSMPIRREGMLIMKSAVAVCDFLIGLLPNLLLAMIFAALMRENAAILLLLGLYCLFGFALAYSFTLLCGTVCGTRSFHVIFTGIAAFIGTAALGAVYLIANTTCNFLETDYLVEEPILAHTSPFLYVIAKLEEQGCLSPAAILILCALSLLYFAAALLLIRIRPTEGAESSMIFRPVGRVFKYTVMALFTVYFGYFFGEIFGSDTFWLGFGLVSGALLSFMLMNVLIHRNARKMFAGLGGLLVFAVAFSASLWGIDGWFSYKDTHGFAPEQIESVSLGDRVRHQFTVTDPEATRAAVAFTDGYFAELSRVTESDRPTEVAVQTYSIPMPTDTHALVLEDLRVAGLGSRTVYLTQTTKWGTSRTWRLRFDHFPSLDDETAALCRAIADSDEFAEQYIGMVMNGGSDLYGIIRDREEGQGEWSKIPEDEFIANSPTYRAIEAELREQISFDFFQQRIVGYVGVVMENERGLRYWMDLPIYESQPALLAASGSELTPEHVIEEEIAAREMTLVGVHRDPATGDLLDSVVLEGEAAAELYRANFNCVNWRDAFFLTRLDRNYIFQSPEKGMNVYFIAGKVPQAVIDLFEKN